MPEPITHIKKNLKGEETAFGINELDTSEVLSKASIKLPVEHHILRPDEWLILRNVDWLYSLITVILGAWIIGFINVLVKLLIEHNSTEKIKKLDISEFVVTICLLALWAVGLLIYKTRFNQRFKITKVDRQALVDDIDDKLKLKFRSNG